MKNRNHLISDLEKIRKNSPLVHNITNYVVMNNTANALLAIGASPVMAHAFNEMEEMTGIASALVINIGTLENEWVESMIIAGKNASRKGIPIILDPVGAGATAFRTETCNRIIKECKPSIIRGNASEIMALINSNIQTKGVDSTASSSSAVDSAKLLAKTTGAIVVISGETDYIISENRVEEITNGSPLMAKVTGMGCTASAIIGAFAAVNNDYFLASVHAMAVMGITGEIAASRSNGPGTMQLNFLDELYNLSDSSIFNLLKN